MPAHSQFPRGLDYFVEDYKHRSGVEKWEQEYSEQVRRRDDSVARFTRYYHIYTRRMEAAVRRIEAVGVTRSGTAILTAMATARARAAVLRRAMALVEGEQQRPAREAEREDPLPIVHDRAGGDVVRRAIEGAEWAPGRTRSSLLAIP